MPTPPQNCALSNSANILLKYDFDQWKFSLSINRYYLKNMSVTLQLCMNIFLMQEHLLSGSEYVTQYLKKLHIWVEKSVRHFGIIGRN